MYGNCTHFGRSDKTSVQARARTCVDGFFSDFAGDIRIWPDDIARNGWRCELNSTAQLRIRNI